MNFEWQQWVVLFLPVILGTLEAFLTPTLKGAGGKINARPPPWAFGVIWTILFLLFGASWAFSIDQKITLNDELDLSEENSNILVYFFYALNLLLLMLWTPVYHYSKKLALYVLALCILGTLLCYSISPKVSKICLSPLIIWEIFALMLNYTIVNE